MTEQDIGERILLRREEAARLLGIHPKTVQRLTSRGTLAAVRVGRAVRYRRVDLELLVEALADGGALVANPGRVDLGAVTSRRKGRARQKATSTVAETATPRSR